MAETNSSSSFLLHFPSQALHPPSSHQKAKNLLFLHGNIVCCSCPTLTTVLDNKNCLTGHGAALSIAVPPFPPWLWAQDCPSKSAFLGQCFTDVNSKTEASSAQYGGRLKVVKCRESRPFPIK